MKKKLLATNTLVAIIYQLIVVVCGFILPRVILGEFGSELNGLVNSITQFLSVISFMELGVGAVVSSELYGPLLRREWKSISIIVSSAEKFFKKLATILCIYVVILFFLYPYFAKGQFDFMFTASLLLIISINSFAQYYIGVVDNLLLGADQRAFIVYSSQAIAHLLNTVLCIIFIHLGAGIHIVKLTTAIIYVIRPIFVRLYVKRNYQINRHKKIDKEPLGQKWNAMAQHISECVLDSTDVIILTLFSSLSNVSIYYVYNLVVYNLKNFFLISASSGILSLEGQIYASGDKKQLRAFFDQTEWILHNLISLLFGITAVLIVPFVGVYTKGINDANYIQPIFAFLIVLAHAAHCFRLPYFLMVKAAGMYRETQNCFIYATVINIILSIVLVWFSGLPGVAIGTVIGMGYQTIYLAIYVYRNLTQKKLALFVRRLLIDTLIFGTIYVVGSLTGGVANTYIEWALLAIRVSTLAIVFCFIFNMIFEKNRTKKIIEKIKKKLGE